MKLLYLGPENSLSIIRKHLSSDFEVEYDLDYDSISKNIHSYHAILDAYMRVTFDTKILRKAEKLKLFVTATTGADHINNQLLNQKKIPLLTLKGQNNILKNVTAASEHSWLLLMACARKLKPALSDVLNGAWDRNKFPGIMLRGKTIGLIGCGRIGQRMSEYARGFGMECIGYDPYIQEWPDTIIKTELPEILSNSDFISIHVPFNDETRNLMNSMAFQLMKEGAVLINTSRGGVIDERAMLKALESGKLGAAGLDVLVGEPDVSNNPLVKYAQRHDNLIITPHIGGFSPDALNYVLAFSCNRILEYFGLKNG